MLELEFENRVKNFRITRAVFEKFLKRAEKVLRGVRGTVTLVLTGDTQIKALNKTYRGVDKPTDVLSFSYQEGARFPLSDVAGEILIAVPTARRQAREHSKTVEQELQFLFVHGLLHVFGYDHVSTRERKIMFDLQDKILGDKSWRAIADREAGGITNY